MSNIKIRRPLTRVKNLYSCDEEQANCANIDGKKKKKNLIDNVLVNSVNF